MELNTPLVYILRSVLLVDTLQAQIQLRKLKLDLWIRMNHCRDSQEMGKRFWRMISSISLSNRTWLDVEFSLPFDTRVAVPPSLCKLGAIREKKKNLKKLLVQPNADAACAEEKMHSAQMNLYRFYMSSRTNNST